MVIPIGGGGDDDGTGGMGGMGGMMSPMVGPTPDFLISRFKKIKVCLVAMIISLVVQLGSGIPLMPSNALNIVMNSLNALFIIIVGIFLLKDDPMFARSHACLVRNFCFSCADSCQGGMPCLCSWFFICLLTAILALIPMDGSQISTIIGGFRLIANPHEKVNISWGFRARSIAWYVLFYVFLASEVVLLLSQLVGGWQGFKAFREMHRAMSENGGAGDNPGGLGGGGYAGGAYDGRAGDGPSGAGARSGGAYGGPSGGAGSRYGGGNTSGDQARAPALFSGTGNRLGS
mmetsp:Transcript_14160/g.24965  ORF Transcript_14160/g.24965 Transcript_14160/m.24965 type:complete len:289 (+) Transcript_14160:88-954(+)